MKKQTSCCKHNKLKRGEYVRRKKTDMYVCFLSAYITQQTSLPIVYLICMKEKKKRRKEEERKERKKKERKKGRKEEGEEGEGRKEEQGWGRLRHVSDGENIMCDDMTTHLLLWQRQKRGK